MQEHPKNDLLVKLLQSYIDELLEEKNAPKVSTKDLEHLAAELKFIEAFRRETGIDLTKVVRKKF
jgi:hypothetical protein